MCAAAAHRATVRLLILCALVWPAHAFAHHETAKVRYFARRCADGPTSAVLACIHRATLQFHVSYPEARYIAHRESRYDPRVCNAQGSGACGLYQFMPGTWAATPYGHHSVFSAKWASLAYGWMVKHGHADAWACC